MQPLEGKKIAILATDGFEQSELQSPKGYLTEKGAHVDVISLHNGVITGWDQGDWGDSVTVDYTLEEVDMSDYDGLVLPGGVINPDLLRKERNAINAIQQFHSSTSDTPIAAICHGPWLLIEAQLAKGKTLTSYESIKTDMMNAGVNWVDQDVAVDGRLITSRNPNDLDAFNRAIVNAIID